MSRPNPSNSDLVEEAMPDDLTHYMRKCSELAQQLEQAEQRERTVTALYNAARELLTVEAERARNGGMPSVALYIEDELGAMDRALTPDEGADA